MLRHPLILFVILTFYGCINTAEALKCYVCSSDKLEICSTLHMSPGKELPSELCSSNIASCFTKIENGITIRGCSPSRYASSLLTSKECNGNNQCDVCKTNKCNGNVFPESRLHCLHCAGTTCVNQTDTIDVRYPCVKYTDDDKCYSVFSFDGSIAYRGCKSDPGNSFGKDFCFEHPHQCVECSKRGCNNNPLKWDKKLSCVKCKPIDENSCNLVSDDFKASECAPTAQGYNNGCYIYVEKGKTERGCLYEASIDVQTECENFYSESCTLCNSSDCNRAKIPASVSEDDFFNILSEPLASKCSSPLCNDVKVKPPKLLKLSWQINEKNSEINSKTIECVKCNSETDENCAKNPKSITPTECDHEGDKCATFYTKDNKIIRNCLQTILSEEDVTEEDEENNIIACPDSSCDKTVSEEQFCYQCDSRSNPNCTHKLETEMMKECPSDSEDLGCYHMITDSYVIRGCVVSLKDEEKEKCQGDSDSCKTCHSNACNEKTSFSQCYVSGTAKDFRFNGNFRKKIPMKICENYDDTCFVLANGNDVVRGCSDEYIRNENLDSKFFGQLPDPKYQLCSEPLCNDNDVKQLRCYECDSASNTSCVENVTNDMLKICTLEVHTGCYHYKDSESNVVRRGCLADLSDDHRELCETDSDQCKKCLRSGCNAKLNFQRCLTCDNDPSACHSELCKRYDDECYIHVSNNTVRKGCLSHTADAPFNGVDIVNDCNKTDLCEKCSDRVDCNDKTIPGEYCLVCDSQSSSNCTEQPNHDMRTKCPLAVKEMGCYLAKDSESDVTRGCLSGLSFNDRHICKGNNDTCKPCMGDSCNIKRSFQSCFECDSEDDGPDCEQANSDALRKLICTDYMGECYTRLENGNITRGCIGDANVPESANCSDPNTCTPCSDEENCNNVPITAGTCISCDSITDKWCRANLTNAVNETCSLSLLPPECYHFINQTTGHVGRGCISNLDNEDKINECQNNSNECKSCIGTNCNSRINFGKCLYCDSAANPNCAINTTSIDNKICKNYNDECFVFIDKTSIKRGCLQELDNEVQDQCISNETKCETCTSDDNSVCNTRLFVLERCVECDTETDEKCRDEPELYVNKICNTIELTPRKGCYLKIVNDRYARGCMHDLPEMQMNYCSQQSEKCKSCPDRNCNVKHTWQKCFKCNSRDEPRCAQSSTLFTSSDCKNYLSTCLTGIDAHGHTHRGCSKGYESDYEQFGNKFDICSKNDCNGDIYPPNRLQCYQCSGEDECNLMPSNKTDVPVVPLEIQPCNVLSEHDQCYTYIGKDGNMSRGCLTDPTDSRLLCEKDGTTCVKCADSGCNDQPQFQGPTFSCIKCNDTTHCAFGQNAEKAMKCEGKVPFSSQESCYTRIVNETGVIERGCTIDVKESKWCTEENGCETCNSTGCNIGNKEFHWCVQCSSNIGGECSVITDSKNFTEQCDGNPYPYSKKGCFTIQKDDRISRGCVKDLEQNLYEECLTEKWCEICKENNCNEGSVSSAKRILSSVLLSFSSILLILRYIWLD